MSKTIEEVTQELLLEAGISDIPAGSILEPFISHARFTVEERYDTGEVDEKDNPIYKCRHKYTRTSDVELTLMCSMVASSLSGTTFTGEDVQAVLKTAISSL